MLGLIRTLADPDSNLRGLSLRCRLSIPADSKSPTGDVPVGDSCCCRTVGACAQLSCVDSTQERYSSLTLPVMYSPVKQLCSSSVT